MILGWLRACTFRALRPTVVGRRNFLQQFLIMHNAVDIFCNNFTFKSHY